MRSTHAYYATLLTGALCAAPTAAQSPAPPAPPPPDKLFFLDVAPLPPLPPLPVFGGSVEFVRSEGGVPGPVVKGKPYSARSITESTQTLADGNRITQRNESVIYRDSEGRSRRELTLNNVGPWQTDEPVTMINIHDPVAGKAYVLDPVARTARESRRFEMAIAHAEAPPGGANVEVRAFYAPGSAAPAPAFAAVPLPPGSTGMYEPAEDLGEQVLEGLLVQGRRMTDTIPAGVIGNERPIEIVTERWHSKDIDAVVLERFADPRFGETIYRLVNVVLGDPSPTLFEVPQGYELEAAQPPRAGLRALPGKIVELELRSEPAR